IHRIDVVVVAVGAGGAQDDDVDLGRAARAAAHLVDDPLEGRVDVGAAASEVMSRAGQGDDDVGGVAGQIAGDLGMGGDGQQDSQQQEQQGFFHPSLLLFVTSGNDR